jgi:hypothetical protein
MTRQIEKKDEETWLQEEAWIRKMAELEEELGPIVPGGAQGNPKGRVSKRRSAAERARARVRLTFQAIDEAA